MTIAHSIFLINNCAVQQSTANFKKENITMTAATLSHTFCHVCDFMKEAAVKFGKSLNRGCKIYAVARACGELAKEGHHKEAKQLMIMYTNGEI
jgi:hypothetical protein